MCAAGREHHRRGRPSAGSTVGPASASPDPRREQWVVMTCCSRFDFGTASSVASALRRRSSAAWSDGRTAWRLNRRPRGPSLRDELDCGEPPARHSRPDDQQLFGQPAGPPPRRGRANDTTPVIPRSPAAVLPAICWNHAGRRTDGAPGSPSRSPARPREPLRSGGRDHYRRGPRGAQRRQRSWAATGPDQGQADPSRH